MGAHTRVSVRIHYIFSTKDRQSTIPAELEKRLWAYIGGITRKLDGAALAVGGVEDHVHIFILLPPTISVAEMIQKVKANSSRWLREQTGKRFEWQEGYAAFSVGMSQTEATIKYIDSQREHHRRKSVNQELRAILQKHGL
ncbi:MAG: IS200/IS605 family transposase [Terriglobales bacterium]|jgi:putative transposase